jgi:hypothetical protein
VASTPDECEQSPSSPSCFTTSRTAKVPTDTFISIIVLYINLLSLNLGKTHFMHFINKNIDNTNIKIIFEDKQISKVTTTKFLGPI